MTAATSQRTLAEVQVLAGDLNGAHVGRDVMFAGERHRLVGVTHVVDLNGRKYVSLGFFRGQPAAVSVSPESKIAVLS